MPFFAKRNAAERDHRSLRSIKGCCCARCIMPLLTVINILQQLGALGDGRHDGRGEISSTSNASFFLSSSSRLSTSLRFLFLVPLSASERQSGRGECGARKRVRRGLRKRGEKELPLSSSPEKISASGSFLHSFFFSSPPFSFFFFTPPQKKPSFKTNHGRPGGGRLPRQARRAGP